MDKKVFKLSAGKCRICGEDEYDVLDVHRILPGKFSGKYKKGNVVALCAVCHRKAHSGSIEIDRYYFCSDGSQKLRIIIDGEELFV